MASVQLLNFAKSPSAKALNPFSGEQLRGPDESGHVRVLFSP
jgi:hypothetical protein